MSYIPAWDGRHFNGGTNQAGISLESGTLLYFSRNLDLSTEADILIFTKILQTEPASVAVSYIYVCMCVCVRARECVCHNQDAAVGTVVAGTEEQSGAETGVSPFLCSPLFTSSHIVSLFVFTAVYIIAHSFHYATTVLSLYNAQGTKTVKMHKETCGNDDHGSMIFKQTTEKKAITAG